MKTYICSLVVTILMRALVILLLASRLAGCGSAPPAPEPGPQSGQGTGPLTATLLTGLVADDRGEPLTGARVEIVDGRQSGLATTTDSAGSFSLTGTFDDATQVRALTGWSPACGFAEGLNQTLEWLRPRVRDVRAGDYHV